MTEESILPSNKLPTNEVVAPVNNDLVVKQFDSQKSIDIILPEFTNLAQWNHINELAASGNKKAIKMVELRRTKEAEIALKNTADDSEIKPIDPNERANNLWRKGFLD